MKKNIRQLLNEINKNNDQIYSIVCRVVAVDETERSCDCEPLNGDAEIFGVRLQSEMNGSVGVVMIPEIDSNVLVTFINKNTGFVSLTSSISKILLDCDEITFNGGSNDGLIKINDLINKINTIENDLNTLKSLFSGWVTVPSDGGASLKTLLANWFASTIQLTQKTDLENDKIKH